MFHGNYPNITVEVITGGTVELCHALCEIRQPAGDVPLWRRSDTWPVSDYFRRMSRERRLHLRHLQTQRYVDRRIPAAMVFIYNRPDR